MDRRCDWQSCVSEAEIGGRLCLGWRLSERARNVKVVSLYMRDSLSLSLSLSCHNSHHSARGERTGAAAATAYTAARNANGQNQSCSNVFLTIQNLVTLLFFEINGIRIHPKFYCDSRLWPFVKEVRFFL